MYKRFLPIFALALFAASCGPSTEKFEPSLAQTQAAQLTEPPTLIPLSEINLEELLIQPGDLPVGFSPSKISTEPPELFSEIAGYEYTVSQLFEQKEKIVGGVTVFLYENNADLEQYYSSIVEDLGESAFKVDGVGEKASGYTINTTEEILALDINELGKKILLAQALIFTDLAFQKCHAIVHIRVIGTDNISVVKIYANILENRLASLVCR